MPRSLSTFFCERTEPFGTRALTAHRITNELLIKNPGEGRLAVVKGEFACGIFGEGATESLGLRVVHIDPKGNRTQATSIPLPIPVDETEISVRFGYPITFNAAVGTHWFELTLGDTQPIRVPIDVFYV